MGNRDGCSADRAPLRIQTNRCIVWIMGLCLGIELALITLDLLFNVTKSVRVIELQQIFDMTRERTVGTWFSTALTCLTGCALLVIFWVTRADGRPKSEALGWLILGLFFLYMSVDDCAYIHERSGDLVKRLVSSKAIPFGLSGIVGRFPSYYWHLVMGPFFAAMGLFMLCFLWSRFKRAGLLRLVFLALAGLAGAMFLDLAEGVDRLVSRLQAITGASKPAVIHTLRLTEESVEILSTILILYAFLKYLSILLEGRAILVGRRAAPPSVAPDAGDLF
jgi:hypothetical protein